ncbi:Dopamine N-acetyltransferase, partial [Orchesella cincta]
CVLFKRYPDIRPSCRYFYRIQCVNRFQVGHIIGRVLHSNFAKCNKMKNYSIVEGPWGRYTFRKVRPEDWDKVIRHIQDYFLRDEPTSKLLGYTDEYGEEFAVLVRRLFLDDLSFWVEDNETGEVAAVRVTYRHHKDTNFDDIPMNSRSMKYMCKVDDMCLDRSDLFEKYNLEECADFFAASCAPNHRNRGIISEMYKRSVAFLKAEGFKLAKGILTSPYTRTAARNLGFVEASRVEFSEVKEEDGTPVFDPKDLNEEHYATMMVKLL